MIRLIDQPPIYLELYDALAHYLGRQQLAVRAITDQGVSISELWKGVGAWYDKTPQGGEWGTEWRFFFHGGGCQLTHKTTGEPIDYDGTDPSRLDPHAFVQHLEWRLSQGNNLPHLREFSRTHDLSDIVTLITDLIHDSLMTPDYHLHPLPGSTHASAA